MGNALYTFDTIVKLGCDLAGNPGLYNQVPADDTESRGYKLLKLLLHHLFLTYDWEFNLVMNTAWSVAQNGFSVTLSGVSNYGHMDQILITSPAGEQPAPLIEMPWKDINFLTQRDNSFSTPVVGLPQNFHVKPDRSGFLIWPIAQKAYSGVFSYYQIPDVSTYVSSTVLPFEDTNALTTALAEIVQRWDKENRSQLMQAVAAQFKADYKAKHSDAGRTNQRQWRWSQSYLKKPSN